MEHWAVLFPLHDLLCERAKNNKTMGAMELTASFKTRNCFFPSLGWSAKVAPPQSTANHDHEASPYRLQDSF